MSLDPIWGQPADQADQFADYQAMREHGFGEAAEESYEEEDALFSTNNISENSVNFFSSSKNSKDNIVKPLISDTMLLYEGYIFNVQMHVILDALSQLEVDGEDIFRKQTRVEKYYKPRNKLWSLLQSLELQSEVEDRDLDNCESLWGVITTFIDEYLVKAMSVYQRVIEEDDTN